MEIAKTSSIESGRLLCLILSKKHTIKDLLYSNDFETTLDSLTTLTELIKSFPSLNEKHIDTMQADPCAYCLFLVSCYESLNSRNRNPHLKVISKLTGDVYAFKTIRAAYKKLETKVKSKDDYSGPIYLRINLFTKTKKEIKKILSNSFTYIKNNADSYQNYVKFVQNLEKDQFTFDYHLPNLLVVFGKGTDLYKNPIVKEKHLIIQDKASCIPPMALLEDDEEFQDVIDCCAAPGNKTSFLAHLMTQRASSPSTLFAFDRNPKRFAFLENHLKLLSVPEEAEKFSLKLDNSDFLEVEPHDKRFSSVTHIMVDPSCSGSGLAISKRIPNINDKNIPALASFQAKILKHCFKFPSVKSIVYSTCSVFDVENEKVVSEVLEEVKQDFNLVHIWPEGSSIYWSHRGNDEFVACLRADQKTDATNGFFVAKFVRK